MNIVQVLGAIEIGLIYGIIAIGVYLSFRILDFPDLTVDGSFPMGAAIAGTLIINGYNPWLSTAVAMLGGATAGIFTAWLNVQWKILHLLASILTSIGLYSINLRIMGRPNIALLTEETIITRFESFINSVGFSLPHMVLVILMLSIIVISLIGILYAFLSTQLGLSMRATGKNPQMATAQGIRTNLMIILGIALSNALIALAGALFTQSQGFADVTMGVGTIIVGLAAVLIGEAIFHSRSVLIAIFSAIIGSILYRFLVALALNSDALGLQASDLNLVTASLVALAMMLSQGRQHLASYVAKVRRAS